MPFSFNTQTVFPKRNRLKKEIIAKGSIKAMATEIICVKISDQEFNFVPESPHNVLMTSIGVTVKILMISSIKMKILKY